MYGPLYYKRSLILTEYYINVWSLILTTAYYINYINVWSLILTTDRVLHKCMVPYINNRESVLHKYMVPYINNRQSIT